MLQFEDLRAGYEGVERLHGLSAALAPGRLTAIIGPNGSGKTTLIKCAAGLLRPMGGQVRLEGTPIDALSSRERALRISYMPQSRPAPDICVEQLALHGRYPHLKWGQGPRRADFEIVEKALARTNLTPFRERSVLRLSGGERQRAYLSMMLAQQAPVMLLDEPTAFLDLSSQFELMALLRAMRDEGRCVAVVLHDLALALEFADEVLLLSGGEIAFHGAPEALYRSGVLERAFGVRARRLDDGKFLFYPLCDG